MSHSTHYKLGLEVIHMEAKQILVSTAFHFMPPALSKK